MQNFFCHANACIVVSHYFACWRTNGLFIYRGSVREPLSTLNHVPSFDLSYSSLATRSDLAGMRSNFALSVV